MNAKYGGIYSEGVIPAKTYPGQDKDNKITVVQNILVANASMPDKVAYDIVKTFIEHQRRSDRRARRGQEHRARQPGAEELADPVASGRGEILHRKRREDVSGAKHRAVKRADRRSAGRPFCCSFALQRRR